MTERGPAILVEGLHCAYGATGFSLRVPSLVVGRGEAVALVGPSGSGKTTLLHAIAGVLAPRSGRVVVDGVAIRGEGEVLGETARRRFRTTTIGLVFQELELLDHLTVRQNLLLPWFLSSSLRLDPAARERVERIGVALGLGPHLDRRPRALSQGERQRVAVGRAVAPSPAVLLADEPTGNLDARTAADVLDLLLEPVRRRGAGLLVCTHDLSLLGRFDRVLDLREIRAPIRGGGEAA